MNGPVQTVLLLYGGHKAASVGLHLCADGRKIKAAFHVAVDGQRAAGAGKATKGAEWRAEWGDARGRV